MFTVSQDEFILSEIFPPEKLIDVNLIQPPKLIPNRKKNATDIL